MAQRFKAALPYFVGLAIAAYLYDLAGSITYPRRPGQLGPDFWPKIAIGMIAVICLYEIAKAFLLGDARAGVQGITEHLEADDEEEGATDSRARVPLLLAGIVLTLGYAVLVPILGFLLSSYLFLILFMYLGGIRNHVAVWAVSTAGMLLFSLVFLKIVYVSLPRGIPPFDQVTQIVMDLVMVR